jgi:nuclear transcription factor Y gamma
MLLARPAGAPGAPPPPPPPPPPPKPLQLGTLLLPGPDAYSAAVDHLGTEEDPSIDMAAALEAYWDEEALRAQALVDASPMEAAECFKNANDLPLARIKRIMKSDEDVRMISAEAPVLFAKACELFICDLTIRSYAYTAEDKGKRRTLTREDVCLAVQQTDVYDFLVAVLMPGASVTRARVHRFPPLSLPPRPPPPPPPLLSPLGLPRARRPLTRIPHSPPSSLQGTSPSMCSTRRLQRVGAARRVGAKLPHGGGYHGCLQRRAAAAALAAPALAAGPF